MKFRKREFIVRRVLFNLSLQYISLPSRLYSHRPVLPCKNSDCARWQRRPQTGKYNTVTHFKQLFYIKITITITIYCCFFFVVVALYHDRSADGDDDDDDGAAATTTTVTPVGVRTSVSVCHS